MDGICSHLKMLNYESNVLFRGEGFATWYYDLSNGGLGPCGIQAPENLGVPNCSSAGLTLSEIGSSNIVAMNRTLLQSDLSHWCGKEVSIFVNGQKVPNMNLFIGDSCFRCASESAIDLSATALTKISPDGCQDGKLNVTWEIYNKTINTLYDDATASYPSQTTISNVDLPVSERVPTETMKLPNSCESGSWRCAQTTLLEQCITNLWMPRATCLSGVCQGGASPYCI